MNLQQQQNSQVVHLFLIFSKIKNLSLEAVENSPFPQERKYLVQFCCILLFFRQKNISYILKGSESVFLSQRERKLISHLISKIRKPGDESYN